MWLDALYELCCGEDSDYFDLVAIGKATSEAAMLPAEVNSAAAVLMLMAKTYPMNNRNCDGYVKTEATAPNNFKVTVCNPYPRDMMYGVIWGFVSRFEPMAVVEYAEGNPCPADAECCVYDVSW